MGDTLAAVANKLIAILPPTSDELVEVADVLIAVPPPDFNELVDSTAVLVAEENKVGGRQRT